MQRRDDINATTLLVDTILLAALVYLPFASETVAVFHVIFLAATIVALLRPFPPFVVRVVPAMAITAAILVTKWRNGELPGDEVGELPLLIAIVVVVFIAAERHRRADARLKDQFDALAQLRAEREAKLTEELVHSRQREMTRDVASIVAHDINGLLTAIGFEMDDLEAATGANAAAQASIEAVRTTVGDVTATLRDLVNMTQDHPGNARTDLNTVVGRVSSLMQRTALPTLAVTTEPYPAPLLVPLATVRTVHIVMNLVRNGMEAMPDGGELTVTTNWRMAMGGPTALLEVSDTGHGLPPELAARVFDPFFTTKQDEGGSGLGLYSVQQMLAESRGTIEMQTCLGGPTVMRVEIPLLFVPADEAGVESSELRQAVAE